MELQSTTAVMHGAATGNCLLYTSTFAQITVVSVRTRAVRSSLPPAAFAHSASFSPATAASPQRVVSFISVVGCGTVPSSGIRQNRRQLIESATSAHRRCV